MEISDEQAWALVFQYEGFIQKLVNKNVTLHSVREDFLQEFRCQAFVAVKRYYGRGSIFQILGFTKNRVGHKIEQEIVDVVRIPISRKQTKPQLVASIKSVGYYETSQQFKIHPDTLSLVVNNYAVDKKGLENRHGFEGKQHHGVCQDIDIYHNQLDDKDIEEEIVQSEMQNYLMTYIMTEKNDILTAKELYVIVRRFGLNPSQLIERFPEDFAAEQEFDLQSIPVEFEERSLHIVGLSLGVSRERVRQIEKGALDKIRGHLFYNDIPNIHCGVQYRSTRKPS